MTSALLLLALMVTAGGSADYPEGSCAAWLDKADRRCGKTCEGILCPRHIEVAERRLVKARERMARQMAREDARRAAGRVKDRARLAVVEAKLDRLDPRKVAAIGGQLDTFGPGERDRRLGNLRKAIAAEERRATEPPTEPQVDYYAKADAIFMAANRLARTITAEGGAETISAAINTAQQLAVDNWRGQFIEIRDAMDTLIAATRPGLRRVK